MIPAKLLDFLVEKGGGAIVGGFAGGLLMEGVILFLHLRGVQGEVLEHVRNMGWMTVGGVTAASIWLRGKKNSQIAQEAKAIAVEAAATSTMAAEASGSRPPPSAIPEVLRAVTAKRRLSTGVRIPLLLIAAAVSWGCGQAVPVTPPPTPTPVLAEPEYRRPSAPRGAAPRRAVGAEWHVAPNGLTTNDGTIAKPWPLQHALNHPATVKPCDTIWLHGGTYKNANATPQYANFIGKLVGTAACPIIVRQAPGERATLDGGTNGIAAPILSVTGAYTWYWGFEVMSSGTRRVSTQSTSYAGDVDAGWGINTLHEPPYVGGPPPGPGIRFINLVIHDTSGGVGLWSEAIDAELYGCLIYYNGYDAPDRSHGHALYAQNASGTKRIEDNVMAFNAYNGIQIYGSPPLDNFVVVGNAIFQNGKLFKANGDSNLIVVGGELGAKNNQFLENMLYQTGIGNSNMGYGSEGTTNLVFRNNYLFSEKDWHVWLSGPYPGAQIEGNTLIGWPYNINPQSFPLNTYIDPASPPAANRVFVRPSRYEPGRALVAVFNWQKLASVPVDLSGVLQPGAGYEVRNAMNFFGAPVASGTFSGTSIAIPQAGLQNAAPVGVGTPPPTGPQFNTFVVLTVAAGATPTPTSPAPAVTTIPPSPSRTPTPARTGTPTRTPTKTKTPSQTVRINALERRVSALEGTPTPTP